MRAGEEEGDFMRALSVLVHDLRAPLSVASGYLRLIREDRLTSDEDRDRALVGAIEAVRRMSRLCEEASDFGSTHDFVDLPTILVSAEDLTTRVWAILQSEATSIEPHEIENTWCVRVTRADRTASAIACILRISLRQLGQDDAVGVQALANEHGLRFLAGTATERQKLTGNESLPFDPWRGGHGLQLPIAYRDVQRIAGRVWTTASSRLAIGVHLPLEARPS
jgi:hypothetical protein